MPTTFDPADRPVRRSVHSLAGEAKAPPRRRFETPNDADPADLEIALVIARLLANLGRLQAHSDFIERALAACNGILVWPDHVVARCLPQMGEGGGEGEDESDEADASFLIDPAGLGEISPRVFRRLNQSASLRRAVGRATLEWAAEFSGPRLPVLANARYMADALELGESARKLIELVILVELSSAFEEALSSLEVGKRHELEHLLARYLECDQRQVAELIGSDGLLARIGLLSEDDQPTSLAEVLAAGSRQFARALTTEHASSADFLQSFLLRSPAGKLEEADTAHLEGARELATRILGASAASRALGTNILLHGAPGTGKTELARQLADRAGLTLFEVRYAAANGQALSAAHRLGSLLLSLQALRGQAGAAVLLDEAEDIFARCTSAGREARDGDVSKAWMSRLLENNGVPILWTSNQVFAMDRALLRRFTLVYELDELPKSVKRRVAGKYLASLELAEHRLDALASLPGLAPAQLEGAAAAARLARSSHADEAWRFLRLQLNQSRRAMGLSAVSETPAARLAYDPTFVRIRGNPSIPELLAGVRRTGAVSMCLHGVPGTGKSAFARHLADVLDRELVAKSASDLLSKWVGGTEYRIAEMFARAGERADKVVLLLDEADTFLRSRDEARTSWELSQTNEFLSRMERFPGIFICTTNLADRLDAAALRRFPVRLEFLGLEAGQAVCLFERTFLRGPRAEEKRTLDRLNGKLVPSDFINVARRLDLLAADGAKLDLGVQLAEECGSRDRAALTRSVGFVH